VKKLSLSLSLMGMFLDFRCLYQVGNAAVAGSLQDRNCLPATWKRIMYSAFPSRCIV
jgi:hypothetical protein